MTVYKCKNYKFFLPKSEIDEELFDGLTENTQAIVTVTGIDHTNLLIKVRLSSEEHIGLNLRGIEE